MDFLIQVYNAVLYRPLFNSLILLYKYLPGHDFGVAVIALTIIIRLVFYPLGAQAIKAQRAFSKLEPKIKEIQEKHKQDKEKMTRSLMELYQKEKINPFSGCLPLLVQLPILIALYQVFWKGLQPEQAVYLYSFIANPGLINPFLFNIVNLSEPYVLFSVLAGATQFLQTKMITPGKQGGAKVDGFSQMFQKQALYLFPVFTIFILLRLPSAIGLYWTVNNIFSIIQQKLIIRKS